MNMAGLAIRWLGRFVARPDFIFLPSLELLGGEHPSGNDSGEREISVTPGVHFWWRKSSCRCVPA